MMSKIVFITGAAGFLGKYTCHTFANAGWNVYGLGFGCWEQDDYLEWGLTAWQEGEVSEANLLALQAQAGTPDVIVHCAGGSSVGFSNVEPGKDFLWTLASLSITLEFMRQYAPAARIIYPSSAAVYGIQQENALFEKLQPNPYSQYGIHKHIAEQLIASYTKNFNIDAITIRFFSLYGAGLRKQLLWDACQKISDNFLFGGTGIEVRDFLYITDAARLILHCANIEATDDNRIINGGTGVGTTVQGLLSLLAETFNIGVSPKFSGEARRGDPQYLVANIEKAKLIGWTPKTELDQGIREYVNWFRNEDKNNG